jgi:hypothetical protein
MKTTDETLKIVFEIIKEHLCEQGEFDEETDMVNAVKTVTGWIEENEFVVFEQTIKGEYKNISFYDDFAHALSDYNKRKKASRIFEYYNDKFIPVNLFDIANR